MLIKKTLESETRPEFRNTCKEKGENPKLLVFRLAGPAVFLMFAPNRPEKTAQKWLPFLFDRRDVADIIKRNHPYIAYSPGNGATTVSADQ